MLWYFEGNYTCSLAVNLVLTAGGDLGPVDQSLGPLRNQPPDASAWTKAWDSLAEHQVSLAEQDLTKGWGLSALARFIHAAIYQLTGEWQIAPCEYEVHSYSTALVNFVRDIELLPQPLERVEVTSPEGVLPGYVIPARNRTSTSPPPMAIFYSGFDVTKDHLYGIIATLLPILASRAVS